MQRTYFYPHSPSKASLVITTPSGGRIRLFAASLEALTARLRILCPGGKLSELWGQV